MKISIPNHPGPWISVIVLIVSLGALGGTVFWASLEGAAYVEVRDKLSAIEAQALRVGTLESRWRSVSKEAELIERAFVRSDQISLFLETVEETARNAGVFEQTGIVEEEDDEITLRLRVSGPFKAIYTFVTHLNVLPNLLFLEKVDFFEGAVVVPPDAREEQIFEYSSAEVIIRIPLQVN